jgi:DNA-binding winged helix-turn-helix (wHTH) protein
MGERYRRDDLRIDVARQRVERDGVALELGGLRFRLLYYLLQQGQRVVSFDELIAQVWAPALVNEETVTQRVRLLRQPLGDASRQPRYLRSVRGQGYRLCVPVRGDDGEDRPAARPRWRTVAIAAFGVRAARAQSRLQCTCVPVRRRCAVRRARARPECLQRLPMPATAARIAFPGAPGYRGRPGSIGAAR